MKLDPDKELLEAHARDRAHHLAMVEEDDLAYQVAEEAAYQEMKRREDLRWIEDMENLFAAAELEHMLEEQERERRAKEALDNQDL